jgi:hypothetical protein
MTSPLGDMSLFDFGEQFAQTPLRYKFVLGNRGRGDRGGGVDVG